MRHGLACMAAAMLPSLVGCNALTGVSDLELVECVGECDEPDAHAPGSPVDAGMESATDVQAEADAHADTALDADAGDVSPDASTDAERDGGCVLNAHCDDGNACTKDLCNGVGVCTNPLDDEDGDGEASTALGACGLDCHDGNPNVFSTQTLFFATAYSTPSGPSFDYDCNGVEEREHTTPYTCLRVGGTCEVTPGWSGSVPACGAQGTWVDKCLPLSTTCLPASTKRVQRCR